jgi:hypothetical protein
MQSGGIEEQKEGMYVDVTPGFVMKTTEMQSKTKVWSLPVLSYISSR